MTRCARRACVPARPSAFSRRPAAGAGDNLLAFGQTLIEYEQSLSPSPPSPGGGGGGGGGAGGGGGVPAPLAAGEASLHLFRTVHRSSPTDLFVSFFSQPHFFL